MPCCARSFSVGFTEEKRDVIAQAACLRPFLDMLQALKGQLVRRLPSRTHQPLQAKPCLSICGTVHPGDASKGSRPHLEDVLKVLDGEHPQHAGRNGPQRDGPHMPLVREQVQQHRLAHNGGRVHQAHLARVSHDQQLPCAPAALCDLLIVDDRLSGWLQVPLSTMLSQSIHITVTADASPPCDKIERELV